MIALLTLLMLALPGQTAPQPVTHGGSPKVSPDGRTIAFGSDRAGSPQIFLIDADGTHERQVPAGAERVSVIGWAADGTRLVVSSTAGGVARVSTISLDGQDRKDVVSLTGRAAIMSPDARRVVYDAGSSYSATPFTVADVADGTTVAPKMINDGKSIAWNSAWSPDGGSIAFTCRDDGNLLQICLIGADGANRRQLTHHTKAEGNAQVPAWSKDGKSIAYQSNGERGFGELWVMDRDGSHAHRILPHTEMFLDEVPSWFPDGTRLAFQSTRSGVMEVWVVNIDGTGLTQVTGRR